MKKIAVVTPYHREADAILGQCRRSVRDQTHPCTHILVADGHPSSAVGVDEHTVHLVLPWEHGD